jgi:ATP adenylyltransferase
VTEPRDTAQPDIDAGPGDGFGRLWTPHRVAYITGAAGKSVGEDDCPFCSIPAMSDVDGLVVARGETVYVVLNLFPYNGGHVLVVPFRHVASYVDLTAEELAEFSAYTQYAVRAITQASHPGGFNIGMNQGSIGGAGIAEHLHQHVVPRWGGDTNFMPVVAQTKVLPHLLGQVRESLADAWLTLGLPGTATLDGPAAG